MYLKKEIYRKKTTCLVFHLGANQTEIFVLVTRYLALHANIVWFDDEPVTIVRDRDRIDAIAGHGRDAFLDWLDSHVIGIDTAIEPVAFLVALQVRGNFFPVIASLDVRYLVDDFLRLGRR